MIVSGAGGFVVPIPALPFAGNRFCADVNVATDRSKRSAAATTRFHDGRASIVVSSLTHRFYGKQPHPREHELRQRQESLFLRGSRRSTSAKTVVISYASCRPDIH